MADKIVIGLTGNIATGKSLILRMLQELGATVIDADKLAHQTMRSGTAVYGAIIEEFGKFIVDDEGEIDRAKLGQIVFSNPDALTWLESVTHPAVREMIVKRINEAPTEVVAIEAIKLFEAGLAEQCQSNWVVMAPPELQLKRLVERRKMSPDVAKQRIKAQSSQKEKATKADVIIDNSGELVKTWGIVKKHYTAVVEKHSKATPAPAAPAPPPAAAPAAPAVADVGAITIRRAKPNDLGTISQLIADSTKGALNPDTSEMMESLFSRAYIVAANGEQVVGVAGWQTENLIAGLQDVYVLQEDLWTSVGGKMLEMIHEEVDKLSCEVIIAFIATQSGATPIEFLQSQGYEQSEAKDLGYMWTEAAAEWQPENTVILFKKLREQRIMVPM